MKTVACPNCQETSLAVRVDDPSQVFCKDCDTEWTLDELKQWIADVSELIRWIETAPQK